MCVSLAQIDTHPNLDLLWSQEDKTETAGLETLTVMEREDGFPELVSGMVV